MSELEYYDRKHEDKSLPFFGNDDKIKAIFLTAPLKLSRSEIILLLKSESEDEVLTNRIKDMFDDEATEIITPDGERYGYKKYQNVLCLWEGEQNNKSAQSYYNWGVIVSFFKGMLFLGELESGTVLPVTAKEFTFTQDLVDCFLTRGSGVSEGKFRIYEQFQKHLSSKENIAFLKDEHSLGGCSPIITGTYISEDHDAKGINLSRGLETDSPSLNLSWAQVEKRISELIQFDRYLSKKEKAHYPNWLEKQQIIRAERRADKAISEVLYVPKFKPIYEYQYCVGTIVYIDSTKYEVVSVGDDTVELYNLEFPLFGNAEISKTEFEAKIKSEPKNDKLKRFVRNEEMSDSNNSNNSIYTPTMQEYFKIKKENPDKIVVFQIGDFFECMGDDAEIASRILDLRTTKRRISPNEWIDMCGFPSKVLKEYTDKLIDNGYTIALAYQEESTQITTKNN